MFPFKMIVANTNIELKSGVVVTGGDSQPALWALTDQTTCLLQKAADEMYSNKKYYCQSQRLEVSQI